jgi:DNA recombination protein RmuC
MDNLVVFALVAASAAALAVAYSRRAGPPPSDMVEQVAGLRAELQDLSRHVATESLMLGQRLEGIDSRMTTSQTSTAELARDIFASLADVRAATTAVSEQAREFTALQDLLKAPKARGGLGEAMLEELLRQVLPPQSYSMQHRFSSGEIVDAAVKVGGRIVCIDSKFPLPNYRRMHDASDERERVAAERAFAADVDKHIKDISLRYVVPDEDTFDFAVMYVPAEGIYGEVLRLAHRKRSLFETAIEQRVVIMSPLTMYGYLQTILFGLKCLSIEKSAQKILGYCTRLQQDAEHFAHDYQTLGSHLGNARSKYEDGARRLERMRAKLDQASHLGDGPEEPGPALEAVGE